MQEVGWKGIELRDAAQYFKLTTCNIIVIFTSEGFVVSNFRQTLRLTTSKFIISAD